MINDMSGELVYVNKTFEEMTGCRAGEEVVVIQPS